MASDRRRALDPHRACGTRTLSVELEPTPRRPPRQSAVLAVHAADRTHRRRGCGRRCERSCAWDGVSAQPAAQRALRRAASGLRRECRRAHGAGQGAGQGASALCDRRQAHVLRRQERAATVPSQPRQERIAAGDDVERAVAIDVRDRQATEDPSALEQACRAQAAATVAQEEGDVGATVRHRHHVDVAVAIEVAGGESRGRRDRPGVTGGGRGGREPAVARTAQDLHLAVLAYGDHVGVPVAVQVCQGEVRPESAGSGMENPGAKPRPWARNRRTSVGVRAMTS